MQVICLRREREYFSIEDWTTQITLIRFNKTAFWRKTPVGSPKPMRDIRGQTPFPRGKSGAGNLTPAARTS
jgi:hypothetical protein